MTTVYVERETGEFEENININNVALEGGVLQISFDDGSIMMYNNNSWKTANVETGEQ